MCSKRQRNSTNENGTNVDENVSTEFHSESGPNDPRTAQGYAPVPPIDSDNELDSSGCFDEGYQSQLN